MSWPLRVLKNHRLANKPLIIEKFDQNMCGFAGVIDIKHAFEAPMLEDCARDMASRIAARGPDDEGVFLDKKAGFAVGFRRLSIIDLSDYGHQPMMSQDGRYVVAFNGEIYNFSEIRETLEEEGLISWRGSSDTEVLLAAICCYGLDKAIHLFDGMFAFALWDIKTSRLHLVRDRLGEKPLYYGWCGSHFLFGSELKAFTAHVAWQPEIEERALTAFLRYSYVPEPFSIYRGIFKLRPGHHVRLDVANMVPSILPKPIPYWCPRESFEASQVKNQCIEENEALDRLENLLTDSIKRRLTADVPLGVLLSGGIDSSIITALAQKETDGTIKTFTLGFEDPSFSEVTHAANIAKILGTDHTYLISSESSILQMVGRASECYDEPFGDISQIPTMLLADMTRPHATAVLSGDGGDELFAGYPRYGAILDSYRGNNRGKRISFSLASSILPAGILNKLKSFAGRPSRLGDKFFRMIEEVTADTPEAMQALFMSRWRMVNSVSKLDELGYFGDPNFWPSIGDDLSRLTYADSQTYLPGDLLVKIDRASMFVGLEVRSPFLNHDLISFAWSLPSDFKRRDGSGKYLLRQLLSKYVAPELYERPKQGFEPPMACWLRGPLREWAEPLLNEQSLARDGWLESEPIRNIWAEHLAGFRDWHFELWNVLMFQAWRDTWRV